MARPQHTALKTEPSPGPTDVSGWQTAVQEGSYRECRLEDLVVALQDLRSSMDKQTLHALASHLSACIFKILRRRVRKTLPNEGQDIIDDVHDVLWAAILRPESQDGKALRVAFTPRLEHRVRDAIARHNRRAAKMAEFASEIQASADRESADGIGHFWNSQEAKWAVEAALEEIDDPPKRLALRLLMDGVPFKSVKGPSIEEALGVSERTIRNWVREAEEILRKHKGDVS